MRRRAVAGLLGGCIVAAACSSGESLLQAGIDAQPATTTAPMVTAAPGSTLPPTTAAPAVTTTTTPLADLPPCPVDALADGTAPVEITFWHALAGENETAIIALAERYNASQTRVRVRVENQGGYDQTIDKYTQSSADSRPSVVMLPEYVVQQIADSESVVPAGACLEASGYDTSAFLPRALLTYQTEGVQWSMPFNASSPVLLYNKVLFQAAGLDPERPPLTLEELRAASQAIVDAPGEAFGIAVESGADSGGGWFLEQWFGRAGELYADNGNGRSSPATRVLYDSALGVELLTYVQALIADGLAVYVGDNAGEFDQLLKLTDTVRPAAMAISSSAVLGTVFASVDGGLIPGVTRDLVGVGPMPGPSEQQFALFGGASLYVVAGKGAPSAAAAWDFVMFLTSAQAQSSWAAATGYVPIRADALELDPVRSKYLEDPRYRVAYDQLASGGTDPASLSPILGPQREVRSVTAGGVASIMQGADAASTLAATAAQANALLQNYNARN